MSRCESGVLIEIVGLVPDDDRILLANCEWTSEPIGHELVERLETTVEAGGAGDHGVDMRYVLRLE